MAGITEFELEEWLPVTGYDGLYVVSSHGRVRKNKVTINSKKPYLFILEQSIRDGRYLAVTLIKNKEGKRLLVHVLVAQAFIGMKPSGMQVNHKDGVRTNNHIDNLEYVTPSQNIQHAHNTGLARGLQGSNQNGAILHERQIPTILYMINRGLTQKYISEQFNVHPSVISDIKRGRLWGHVTGIEWHSVKQAKKGGGLSQV